MTATTRVQQLAKPTPSKVGTARGRVVIAGLCSAALLTVVAPVPAQAAASSVSGGAFGWRTTVSLFGGPAQTRGDLATDAVVELPSSGSAVPVSEAVPGGTGAYGPAKIYNSVGPITAITQGEKGDALRAGYVNSSAKATNVGTWTGVMLEDTTTVWEPMLGGEMDPFIGLEVTSECSVSENGTPTGDARIVGGRVVDTDVNGNATNVRDVPVDPAPGTVMTGTLAHVGDNWRITFNEQTFGADGKSITVNAVNLELLGPTAVGNMWIAQSRCGYAS